MKRGTVRSFLSRQWPFLVLLFGSAAGALISVLGDAPLWVKMTTAVVTVVMPLVIAQREKLMVDKRDRQARDAKERATIRENTAGASDELPRIGDVADARAVGAHVPLRSDVPYIERDVGTSVEAAIRRNRRVLLVGPSMAGKTHLAFHAAQAVCGDYFLWRPETGAALRNLLTAGLRRRLGPVVVWLDDLVMHNYLAGLTPSVLDEFCRDGDAVVIATIRSQDYGQLTPLGELRPAGWDVVEWFGEYVSLREWTDGEFARLAAAAPDDQLVARAKEYGLSTYLGAAPIALGRFTNGPDVNPVGYALVRAAADWRRVGIGSPIPRTVLDTLLANYWAGGRTQPTASEEVDAGLVWATEVLANTVSLLSQHPTASTLALRSSEAADAGGLEGEERYDVLDFIVDYVDAQSARVPGSTWDLAVSIGPISELVAVGNRAERLSDWRVSRAAYERAAESGDLWGMYFSGMAVPPWADGAFWWLPAAEKGHIPSMLALAKHAQEWDDKGEEVKWLRRAAQAGDAWASEELGKLLLADKE